MSFQRIWMYLGRKGVICENQESYDRCVKEGYEGLPFDIEEKVIKKVVKKKAAKKRAVKKEG